MDYVLNSDGKSIEECARELGPDDKAPSLSIRRSLAGAEPAAWLPDVAMSLNSLGVLLHETGRMTESVESFRLANEAERLSKEAAEGHADIRSLLEGIDALLM